MQNKQNEHTRSGSGALVSGAMIAALYAALTLVLAPISFGPIQLRVSESLTLLPWYRREAVPALTIGCVAANFIGGYGLIDALVGGGATLVAALLTRWLANLFGARLREFKFARLFLAALPPVLVNMFAVGIMLHVLTGTPLVATCIYIGLGQAAACFGVGLPLMKMLGARR